MLDLETLSTRSDAKVLSLGVAIFNETSVLATDGWAIKLDDDVGGHVDWKTVKWWMEQEPAAREFSWQGQITNAVAAMNFKSMLAMYGIETGKDSSNEVWSNDPHFDHTIAENWWHRINAAAMVRGSSSLHVGDFPVSYRQPRSYRTLVNEARALGYDPEYDRGVYVAHNPIDDAASQARVVIAARQFIRGLHRPEILR
ncbi:MAG TPA: 3'-5' exonuclease [Acidobacteriaceae bacterium]|nr:3'-5' exonuclease [Acidobacteriaceae bacterium]